MGGQGVEGEIVLDVAVNIGKDLIHLFMVGDGAVVLLCGGGACASPVKCTVQEYHQFQKYSPVQDILAGTGVVRETVDIIEEPPLFFRRQVQAVGELGPAEMETAVKIRIGC